MCALLRSKGPGDPDDKVGHQGEKMACRLLKQHGLKVLAKNYRCPAGEADLIVLDPTTRRTRGGETIAFVEVKTRTPGQLADPQSAVNSEKRRRLRKIAAYYLAHHPQAEEMNVRFDVVAVVLNGLQEPQLNYIPNAF